MRTPHKLSIAALAAQLAAITNEAQAAKVKIMSYNVWMFPNVTTRPTEFLDRAAPGPFRTAIRLTPEKRKRAEMIAKKLPDDVDVFVFEEAFCADSFRPIEQALRQRGYTDTSASTTDRSHRWKRSLTAPEPATFVREAVEGAKEKVLQGVYEGVHVMGRKVLSSGVRVFARGAIAELEKVAFEAAAGDDAMAGKGFVYCKIRANGLAYHVVGTHMQAWENPASQEARRLQREQIKLFVDGKKIPRTEAVFVVGDMNTAKYTETSLGTTSVEAGANVTAEVTNEQHEVMQHDLNCRDWNRDATKASFNYATNEWLLKGSICAKSGLNQTVDHILTSNAHRQPSGAAFAVRDDFKLAEADAIRPGGPFTVSPFRGFFVEALQLASVVWLLFGQKCALAMLALLPMRWSAGVVSVLNAVAAKVTRPRFEGQSRDLSDHYPVEATFEFEDSTAGVKEE